MLKDVTVEIKLNEADVIQNTVCQCGSVTFNGENARQIIIGGSKLDIHVVGHITGQVMSGITIIAMMDDGFDVYRWIS